MMKFKLYGCFLIALIFQLAVKAQPGSLDQHAEPDSVYRLMKKITDWQIDSIKNKGWRHGQLEWTTGAMYSGIQRFAELATDIRYYEFMKSVGEQNNWKLKQDTNRYHADYYRSGDMFCRMYEIYKDPVMLRDLRLLADTLLRRPHTESLEWKGDIVKREWAWCDALFMAPPVLAHLAKITGERKYMDLCDKLWWKTTDFLYSPAEQLYYRDGSYLTRKEKNGKPVMWSRGNGWVMGGLVQVLDYMPEDYPSRARWIKLYKEMSARVASLQLPDGTWRASLLDPANFPAMETSGTAFFCYALAWGINRGLLEPSKYKDVVLRSWSALVKSVHPNGMPGHVQRIGEAPGNVSYNDTEIYGTGAFLLAGAEVLEMKSRKYRPVTITNGTSRDQQVGKLLKKNIKGQTYRNLLTWQLQDGKSKVKPGTLMYLTNLDSSVVWYSDSVALINQPDNGYRGIWSKAGSTNDEYVVKYGGGLGTYPSNHYPFSVYVPAVNKTFFCYGGSDEATGKTLYHEIGYFDHATKMVSRPTIVLDKGTNDAHDNPVIQVDKDGYIWLFSTSHGIQRESYIHKSIKPYDITKFERVNAVRNENGKSMPLNSFSYMQLYYTAANGFLALFTHYEDRLFSFGKKQCRDIDYMTSKDGITWSSWKPIGKIEEGHYQTSGQSSSGKIGSAFNYHPAKQSEAGLDYRTNLYFIFTDDNGDSWKTAGGLKASLPLTTIRNSALVYDYAAEGLNVYINDVNFDKDNNPVILYQVGNGHMPGPKWGDKIWYTASWQEGKWKIMPVAKSDNNYDMGSIYIEDNTWKIIAPTMAGPQLYNTGGEIVMWVSHDKGTTWINQKQMTCNSEYNHSYPRRPVNAQPGFYALWSDGNGRVFSPSRIYFSDKEGKAFRLPVVMNKPLKKAEAVK